MGKGWFRMFDKDKKYLSAAYISEGYDRKLQKQLVADTCGSVRHAAESAGLIMSNAAMKAAQMVIPEQKIPEFDIRKDISALSTLGISVSALTQPTHIPFVDDKKFLEQFTKAVIPNSVLGTSVFDLTQTVRIPRDVTMGNIQSSLSQLNNIGENVAASLNAVMSIKPFKDSSLLSALGMSVSDLTRSLCIPKEDTIGNIAIKAMQSSLMPELNIREQISAASLAAVSKSTSLSMLGMSVSDLTQSFRIPDAITYLETHTKVSVFQQYIYEHDKGYKKNNEVKLILLGNGRVGKTSIAKRLCSKEFILDEPITHGINRFSLKKKDINFKIWDFGGQDIYHATHQLFLTKDTIYLVIHDNQTDNNDCPLDYWLENIRNLGGNSPIIIVHNKKDESEKRNASMLAMYCEEYGLDVDNNTCAVNAQNKEGFPHLWKLIQTQLEALTHVFEKEIPNSWVAVREKLEEECRQGKKTLLYDEYLDICDEEGLTEENAQVLCKFLHQISALLYFDNFNFSNNSLLIIDPIWASKLIYSVLDPKTSFLKQRMGKFNKKDLFEYFHASKANKKKPLSENEIDNLLKLMLNFELCFKVFGESDEYIAPQFLPEEKEKRSLNLWHYKGSAHLRYRYRKFIPKSTMIRMLSRFGNKIEEMYYWKNGLVWNGQDADALIEAFPQNKYIDVSVQGNDKSLLTEIYQVFHKINGNCPVEIEIPCPCSKCATSSQPHTFGIALVQERHQKYQDIQCQASGEQVKTNDLIGWLNFKETQTVNNQKPLKLFYSYSHKDEELRNELEKHLKLLKRQNLLEGWHDRKIEAGKVWENTLLDENLATADIILFLLSVDFLASDYCYNIEVTQAMKQHEEGISVVIPIRLRPCDLTGAPFMKLQGLPKDLVPVTKWKDRDEAFTDIAIGLRATVEEIWKKRNNH